MSHRRGQVQGVIVMLQVGPPGYREACDRVTANVRRLALSSLVPLLPSLLIIPLAWGMFMWKSPLPRVVVLIGVALSGVACLIAIASALLRNYYTIRQGFWHHKPVHWWGNFGGAVMVASLLLVGLGGHILGW